MKAFGPITCGAIGAKKVDLDLPCVFQRSSISRKEFLRADESPFESVVPHLWAQVFQWKSGRLWSTMRVPKKVPQDQRTNPAHQSVWLLQFGESHRTPQIIKMCHTMSHFRGRMTIATLIDAWIYFFVRVYDTYHKTEHSASSKILEQRSKRNISDDFLSYPSDDCDFFSRESVELFGTKSVELFGTKLQNVRGLWQYNTCMCIGESSFLIKK